MKSSQAGSAVILALVSIGILAGAFTVTMISMQSRHGEITSSRLKANVLRVRDTLVGTIGDQASWNQSILANASMACLRTHTCANGSTDPSTQLDPQQAAVGGKIIGNPGAPAPTPSKPTTAPAQALSNLTIYSASGGVFYDPLDPASGFDMNGVPCKGFSNAGNDNCPLRADIYWTPSCWNVQNPGSCRNPEEMINIKFTFASATRPTDFALNPANYEVNLARLYMGSNTPILRCAQNQMVYVGNFPGLANFFFGVSSDAAGCVPMAALAGPPGKPGVIGAAGSPGLTGAAGPVGPAGGTISPPLPPPPPAPPIVATCTADPNICALYQAVLGRLPEQTGAEGWEAIMAYEQSKGLTYNEALAIVAEGIANSPEANLKYGLATYTPEELAAGIAQANTFAALIGTTGGGFCTGSTACGAPTMNPAVVAFIAATLTLQ